MRESTSIVVTITTLMKTAGVLSAASHIIFLTQSDAGQSVLEQARRAALTDHPVLIMGETGTGKELIARLVHCNRGPLAVVDCTQLSRELADRELFGNVRGAYTGADQPMPGLLQHANGGSAFFDEIGELPCDTQSKLLRVLQEKEFRPVGSNRQQRAQFRIIAATNRELRHEVESGRFRKDLYFRLNVIRITIPPLRMRPEDIRLLLDHYSAEHKLRLSADATAALMNYQWPGNVRELKGLLARLAINARSSIIGVNDLSATITNASNMGSVLSPLLYSNANASRQDAILQQMTSETAVLEKTKVGSNTAVPEWSTLSLADWKKWITAQSFITHKGDITKMSSALKVSRATLYRRLKDIQTDERVLQLLSQVRPDR